MTALPPLRAVVFDLMDTVLYDPYREAIRAATGLELDVAFAHRDPQSWPDFETGKIDEHELARRYFAPSAGAAPRFDLEAFNRVRREGYRFLPGMKELLVSLEGRVERYVASNYPAWIEELGVTFGFDALFERIWVSCRMGVRKPSSEFFERLLDEIGHPPPACLFVDDRRDNCDAARAAGMKAHRFDGVEGLRGRLIAEGVALPPGA